MYPVLNPQTLRRHRVQWRIQDSTEEGRKPQRRGRQPTILINFPENCMKMIKFLLRGGARPRGPPTLCICQWCSIIGGKDARIPNMDKLFQEVLHYITWEILMLVWSVVESSFHKMVTLCHSEVQNCRM